MQESIRGWFINLKTRKNANDRWVLKFICKCNTRMAAVYGESKPQEKSLSVTICEHDCSERQSLRTVTITVVN